MPTKSRYSYGTSVNRRSARTPQAFTVAPPVHYRRRPGLNRGVAVALPGSIAPGNACGVTVYWGSAWTLPAFTGAPHRHYRRQSWVAGASPG
ncbi:hypothetical protein DPMN_155165 [Dreissena polymorpha]|uniref:Uncharacterized protein n=1 Tax=Dreissena polymorpha TaxID=45954 RepID=A0A9D4FT81_DREPO|nr:hypothetical protein DPMN_155165 [Dreissena polymorpha]